MSWLYKKTTFKLFIIIGLILLILSLVDVSLGYGLVIIYVALLIVITALAFILIFRDYQRRTSAEYSVEEFEKRLEGGLYHFKCQVCGGIFAIKKSKSNNKKMVKMTCPDCGAIGYIPSRPKVIKAVIPEEKSAKAIFKCRTCGEGLTIWAEGTTLHGDISIYTCPFCGTEKKLNRF